MTESGRPLLAAALLCVAVGFCALSDASTTPARRYVSTDEAETHLLHRPELTLPGRFNFRVPVTANVQISASGEVTSVEITSTTGPDLNREAVKTIRRWRYRPWLENGIAVPVEAAISMNVIYVESWKGRLLSISRVLLLGAFGNLVLLVVSALLARRSGHNPINAVGRVPPLLALASQTLYFGMLTAAIFKWMRMYPGNPILVGAIVGGLVLSAAACLTGSLWAKGIRQFAAIVGGAVSLGLWLLTLVASAAV